MRSALHRHHHENLPVWHLGACQNKQNDRLSMPFSQYMATQFLNWARGIAVASPPLVIYISLHSAHPGPAGTLNDITAAAVGGRGSIPAANWSLPVASQQGDTTFFEISNTSQVLLSSSAPGTGAAAYFGCWDAASGGNFLEYAPLTNPLTIMVGDVVRFSVGALTLRKI